MNINDTLKDMNVSLPDDIRQCQRMGNYDEAIRLIDYRLAQSNLPQCLRNSLVCHREMFSRIVGDFPHTTEDVLAQFQTHLPAFTMEELQSLMDQRYIRWIYVNGEKRLYERSFESAKLSVRGMAQRIAGDSWNPPAVPPLDAAMWKMKEQGSLTNRIRIRATAKLKDEHFTPGMFLRVHLPIPAACQQQSDIRIEKIWPEGGVTAPEDAAQRTVCWECTPDENVEFGVEYSYVHTARYHDAYNGKGQPGCYDFDLQEQQPHIVFSPYIQSLCAELTKGIDDPLMKARAFYDFITLNMHYTYMPEYFVLEDIAGSCARNYNGDCGVFALLFITLCRCAGIPAQWQSGMAASPDNAGCHDWARFYVEPYGWLYADPSYGTSATRLEKEERRQFYFGNLEANRMVANREFQADFTIPKEHWRADPYDNQTGEMETTGRGFRPEEYVRQQSILLHEEIPTP